MSNAPSVDEMNQLVDQVGLPPPPMSQATGTGDEYDNAVIDRPSGELGFNQNEDSETDALYRDDFRRKYGKALIPINKCPGEHIRLAKGVGAKRAEALIKLRTSLHRSGLNLTRENINNFGNFGPGMSPAVWDQFDFSPVDLQSVPESYQYQLQQQTSSTPNRPPGAVGSSYHQTVGRPPVSVQQDTHHTLPTRNTHHLGMPVFSQDYDTRQQASYDNRQQASYDNRQQAPRNSRHQQSPYDPRQQQTPFIKRSPSNRQENDCHFLNRLARRSVVIPKGLTFDGTGSFSTFREKFRSYLYREDFPDDGTDLYALSLSLQGKASEFYERTNARCRFASIASALGALQERFDTSKHWKSALLHFHSASQAHDEGSQEYEDRLWALAHQAYPQHSQEQVEKEVLLRFILGLKDRSAVQYLSLQGFNTLREAADGLRLYEYSLTVSGIRPQSSKLVRQVEVTDSSEDISPSEYCSPINTSNYAETDTTEIRQVQKEPGHNFMKTHKGGSAIERLESSISDLTSVVKDMAYCMKEMKKEITDLRSEVKGAHRQQSPVRSRLRAKSPTKVSFSDQRRSVSPRDGCFECGSLDHFRSSCPKRAVRSVGSDSDPYSDQYFDQDFRWDQENNSDP